MSWTRWVLIGVAVGGAAFATLYVASSGGRTSEPEAEPAPPRTSVEPTVHGAGIVEPPGGEIEIGSAIEGVVAEIPVTTGQDVGAGDVLVRLDSSEPSATVAARERELIVAESAAAEARIAAADAQDELRRSLSLGGMGMSERELARRRFAADAAEAAVRTALAEVERARAAVEVAVRHEERHTLRAPYDGRVLRVNVQRGELLGRSSAEPALVLGRSGPLRVRADFDEHDAWRIGNGGGAVGTRRGEPDGRIPLRFLYIEPLMVPKRSLTGRNVERVDTRVVQVVFEIASAYPRVFPGQQLDVVMVSSGAEGREQ